MAVLLLHNTTHHYQALVPNFRILTQVVAEKLTEKKSKQYVAVLTYILYKGERRKKKKIWKKKAKWGLAS